MHRFGRRRRFFTPRLCLILAALAGDASAFLSSATAAPSDSLTFAQERYQARQAEFAAELAALAADCERLGLPAEAAGLRGLAVPIESQALDIDALPAEVRQDQFAGLPVAERERRVRLRKLQQDYAADLYLLSRRALNNGHVGFAFHLVREVAFHDPDHERARKLLGYVRYKETWTTPFTAAMLRRGYIQHERFGWLPANHVERYENSLRYFEGRWVTIEKEAAFRRDFDNAWEILTEHFLIRTNHSLERGVELGVALEEFHRFFMRTYAAFFSTPQQMQRLFDGGSPAATGGHKRHVVHYYQSRDEFVQRLQREQPNIQVSNGLYLPSTRTAYFYFDAENEEANEETLFHEVTHQLLGESALTVADVGRDENFWLIEGIACYMESYRRRDGRSRVGDPRHVRIHWARVRVVEEDFYIPLAQFSSLGMRAFQGVGDLPTLQRYYSQAAGLTHFFLHYDSGVYRDPLLQHLAQIYSPNPRIRAQVQSLPELTGVSSAELDRQYREYLQNLSPAQ